MSLLDHEIVEVNISSAQAANACVIWLHGLGANGHDFVPIVPHLQLPPKKAVRFIFPHAPSIPVTINANMKMPAWYDITEMNIERTVDEQALKNSAQEVIKFVEQQNQLGIDYKRIIIAGFSQGGAVAYQAALSYQQQLGGLMALSTYFATANSCTIRQQTALPIAIYHGSHDPVVPEVLGQQAQRTLSAAGFTPEYKTYPIEHNVSEAEIADISNFLNHCLRQ